jgi:leucyl-tRNA synthetase
MPYEPKRIEEKWQRHWATHHTFRAENGSSRPKFFALDMFPYPSGAGLHVGHPLGYIASDIVARYKRHQGFNVLHPMGWDAFGLPAEQYAIQTGQHPSVTTEKNIGTYREQLDRIGLSFDWDREVNTSDPAYYKWTQWAFGEMFEHWYDTNAQKARPIQELKDHFASKGNVNLSAHAGDDRAFAASEWKSWSDGQKEDILQKYRLAYLADLPVNWCAALGTVLANDEVVGGLSVRGGHPVEQKIMKQWSLRISAYADRLLTGLDTLDWSEAVKEMQRHWIGKSVGAEMDFALEGRSEKLRIFTTRPDTIFGVSFMVLAPESEWVDKLTTPAQKAAVAAYVQKCKQKTERERQAEVNNVTGVFTGANAIHPFTGKPIPVWIGDYVLGGYGTGAIMAVPAHDLRDHAFALKFKLPITEVVSGGADVQAQAHEAKSGKAVNSDFLNGLETPAAIARANEEIEKRGLGLRKTNFRLRDAIFSRQRYWGEPFPVFYENGQPRILPLSELPVELPDVDKFLPTETGEPPLGRAKNWVTKAGLPLELSTMPGFAGSSAYYLRYMDPKNTKELVSQEAAQYWRQVDLYIGGTEHATGHLIYSRYWCQFLFDLGVAPEKEPFKKLVNQGMIQGRSAIVYRLKNDPNTYVSSGLRSKHETVEIHVDVSMVHDDRLDMDQFRAWRPDLKNAKFLTESYEHAGNRLEMYRCGSAVEKMSKSLYNVVNPDRVCDEYGADTLRLFEMFLGPLEQSKPWNTSSIEGVFRFLQKLWRWAHGGDDRAEALSANDVAAPDEAMRVLHQSIEKITRDVEAMSFNTVVSQLMILVNELTSQKVTNRAVMELVTVLVSPIAPHIAEELWEKLGHEESVERAPWPKVDSKWLVADSMKIVVQVNGKLRGEFTCAAGTPEAEVLAQASALEEVKKFTEGKEIKKRVYVPKKLVNFVAV